MANSRRKGKEGELEVVNLLKKHGFDVARGQQHVGFAKGGKSGTDDVIGLPGIHIEVKRVQQLNIEKAMQQSRADAEAAGTGASPVVFHRKDREPWKVTMDAGTFVELYKRANL